MPAVSFAIAVAVHCAADGQGFYAKIKAGKKLTLRISPVGWAFTCGSYSSLESGQCRTRVQGARVRACSVLGSKRRKRSYTLPRIVPEVPSKHNRGGTLMPFPRKKTLNSFVCAKEDGAKTKPYCPAARIVERLSSRRKAARQPAIVFPDSVYIGSRFCDTCVIPKKRTGYFSSGCRARQVVPFPNCFAQTCPARRGPARPASPRPASPVGCQSFGFDK